MSIPARVMAIADIFEALTAADRPYKPPKKVSEALRIMRFMVKDGHIDPDLFRLFLQSGVYKRYADQYLKPEQNDDADLGMLLDGLAEAAPAPPAPVESATEPPALPPICPIPAAPRTEAPDAGPLAWTAARGYDGPPGSWFAERSPR
jgi:hypothetical protein